MWKERVKKARFIDDDDDDDILRSRALLSGIPHELERRTPSLFSILFPFLLIFIPLSDLFSFLPRNIEESDGSSSWKLVLYTRLYPVMGPRRTFVRYRAGPPRRRAPPPQTRSTERVRSPTPTTLGMQRCKSQISSCLPLLGTVAVSCS